MRGCFLIARAKEPGEQRPGSAEQSFDELGRLPRLAEQVQRLAGDQVTHNQNNSQHAVCELIRQSAVKALGDKICCKSRASPRSEGHDD